MVRERERYCQRDMEVEMGLIAPLKKLLHKSPKTFTVFVDYKTPKYADLQKAYDYVYRDYAKVEFERRKVCMDLDTTPREIGMSYFYRHLDGFALHRDSSSEKKLLVEMERCGVRPIVYEELVAFKKKFPEELWKFPIVALGSTCLLYSIDPECPCIFRGDTGSVLGFHVFGGPMRDHFRFLVTGQR